MTQRTPNTDGPSGRRQQLLLADDRLTGHWRIADRLGVFQQLQAAKHAPAGHPGAA